MANYVRKIRTESGEMQIDYLALANLPQSDATLTKAGSFADAKATGDAIAERADEIVQIIENLTPEDIGALPDTYVPPVTSVNGATGDVQVSKLINGTNEVSVDSEAPGILFYDNNTVVGGMTVDPESGDVLYQKYQNGELVSEDKIHTDSTPIEYPVTSVQGKTGDVTLIPSEIGAADASHAHENYMPKFTFTYTASDGVLRITT